LHGLVLLPRLVVARDLDLDLDGDGFAVDDGEDGQGAGGDLDRFASKEE
jgi:hypothetical protein